MAAKTGPHESASAEAEGAESRSAVATMTRLIRDLYASDGSYAAIRGGRESDLIDWSEMLGTVRREPGRSRADVP